MIEWDIPFMLTSPRGTLLFNTGGPGTDYRLIHTKCSAGPVQLRQTIDHIPQGDGAIIHRQFKAYYAMTLSLELWSDDEQPAWFANRRTMWDTLAGHLNAIVNADGRIQWTPSGYPVDRMLDAIRLLQWPVAVDEDVVTAVTFAVHTRFPYAMDAPQTVTNIPNGTTATITNAGNADFFPVFKVNGPAGPFTIYNNTTGLRFNYDTTLPGAIGIGGGHYAELDFFRNTAYLDGNLANLKAGIDILTTDFFPLVPGVNQIHVAGTGTSADMLWQNAWI